MAIGDYPWIRIATVFSPPWEREDAVVYPHTGGVPGIFAHASESIEGLVLEGSIPKKI